MYSFKHSTRDGQVGGVGILFKQPLQLKVKACDHSRTFEHVNMVPNSSNKSTTTQLSLDEFTSFHLYADNTQLYLSFKTEVREDMEQTMLIFEKCAIDTWKAINKLKLNRDKTELLVLNAYHCPSPSLESVAVSNEVMTPSSSARNIGVLFDYNIIMEQHVTALAFYHLRNISHIRKYISFHTAEILMHAFVTSRLDFCNSLLYGIPQNVPKRLQSVQNAAARVVTLTGKTEHITPILEGLHWLPVEQHVILKILLITYKVLNNLAPVYPSELVKQYLPNRNLRSSNPNRLVSMSSNLRAF